MKIVLDTPADVLALLLGSLLVVGCATTAPTVGPGETLPRLTGPVLGDGRSAPGAWEGARVIEQRDVSVKLGRVDGGIAVKTETARPSIATVLVAASDRVWLLHASAALGTGEYRCRQDGRCSRVRDFEWSCRDPSASPEAVACREAFRAKEGWVGNVASEGGRVRELLILPDRFAPSGGLRLVVTVLTLPDVAMNWPAVADDSASLAVQQGALPDEVRLDVGRWLEIPR